MALIAANLVKRITASGGGDLEAQAGRSLLVKAVYCIPSTNDTYLTLRLNRRTVAYFRVKTRSGNHLSPILAAYKVQNMMDFLNAHGINVTIPVATGETFSVSRYAETGNVMILYDEYDAADMVNTMPNGSNAQEYTFLQYMSTSVTPTATQDVLLDTALTPAEFPDFPCGKNVPANTEITLLGIFGHPFTTGAAGPENWGTSFAKLVHEREVLFDPDRNGIPFDGQAAAATADAYGCNFSLIGAGVPALLDTAITTLGDPLILDPPKVFASGEELLVYLSGVMVTGAQWEETMVDFGLIQKVRRTA